MNTKRQNMNRSSYRLLPAIILGLAVLGMQGCYSSDSKADIAKKKDETPAIPVEAALVKRGDVDASYTATTTLEAQDEAVVVAKTEGVIKKIYVEEGQHVKAGDILAKLDDEKLLYQLEGAKANLDKKQHEFERNKELYSKHLISSNAYETSKFELAALKSAYDLAKLSVDYTAIRAPISGVVSKRFIKPGNMLTQNQQTFVITDFDPLLATLHVPERELSKLKDGQPAILSTDALPGQRFKGTIDRISPVVDPATGTFKVTVAMRDPSHYLKPGMFGRVNIVYDTRHDALLVPRSAVITEDTESNVFVIDKGVAHRTAVDVGYTDGGAVQIVDGVKEGESVVTVGQTSLKDGAKVQIVSAGPASPADVADTAKKTDKKS